MCANLFVHYITCITSLHCRYGGKYFTMSYETLRGYVRKMLSEENMKIWVSNAKQIYIFIQKPKIHPLLQKMKTIYFERRNGPHRYCGALSDRKHMESVEIDMFIEGKCAPIRTTERNNIAKNDVDVCFEGDDWVYQFN